MQIELHVNLGSIGNISNMIQLNSILYKIPICIKSCIFVYIDVTFQS